MYTSSIITDALSGRGALSQHSPATRSIPLFSLLVSLAILAGCAEGEPDELPVTLAGVDSVLSELGGPPTASLERGQRWRMISSIGAGLPPSNFSPEDLPEPRSRGAGLLQVYCIQCHWLPAPQMHSATEWPLLVRRMQMRSRTLRSRLGGPLTTALTGEVLMGGMKITDLPSPADLDTLVNYLQKYALQAVEPGELGDGPDVRLYVDKCGTCHETPSPLAHTAAGWEQAVARMRGNMALMDVDPLSDEDRDSIVAFVSRRAAGR